MISKEESNSSAAAGSSGTNSSQTDPRIEFFEKETELSSQFIRSLFNIIYEIYNSSAGSSVRHKCLRALLRIIYYASPDLLSTVLKCHSVSSHIAAMLASSDLRIVVGAIEMSNILMEKLSNIFSVYFVREGVLHQFNKLMKEPDNAITEFGSPIVNSSSNASPLVKSEPNGTNKTSGPHSTPNPPAISQPETTSITTPNNGLPQQQQQTLPPQTNANSSAVLAPFAAQIVPPPCYQLDPLLGTVNCDPLANSGGQTIDQQTATNQQQQFVPVTLTSANMPSINVPINYWPNLQQPPNTLATGINSLASSNTVPTTNHNLLTGPVGVIAYKAIEDPFNLQQPANQSQV